MSYSSILFNIILFFFDIHTIVASEIIAVSTTVLFDSTRSQVSCKLKEGYAFTSFQWKKGDTLITSDSSYTTSEVTSHTGDKRETSLLVKYDLREETKFTCILTINGKDSSATPTFYISNIAGISSPQCKKECTVSCVLSSLKAGLNVPTTVSWETTDGSDVKEMAENENYTMSDRTVIQHRSTEFHYTSRETSLMITNLTQTSYFTCIFKANYPTHVYNIKYTVSALIRPTQKCDVVHCATNSKCRSGEIIQNSTCRAECAQCFIYQYNEGDFLGSGHCKADRGICRDYLQKITKCSNKSLKYDPIAKYCDLCGYCLDLEFNPSKLIMPVIFITALILLTILMCYKSYDERRSILPKVQVTNTDTGKIKGFPFKRNGQQTIIPNRLTESRQYLTPSSALDVSNKEVPVGGEEEFQVDIYQLPPSVSQEPNHHSVEQKMDFDVNSVELMNEHNNLSPRDVLVTTTRDIHVTNTRDGQVINVSSDLQSNT